VSGFSPTKRGISVVNTTYSAKSPILAAILFVTLATISHWRTPLPGDVRIAVWTQGWRGKIPMDIAHFGNWLGMAIPIGVVALLIALGFAARRCWFEAAFVMAAYAAKALNAVIKTIIDAPRPTPDLVRVAEHASSSGFPSGHVTGVALVLGAAALMAQRRFPRLQIPVWTLASAAILITAFGRVYVGAHWPSQTFGGLLAAIVLMSLFDVCRAQIAKHHLRNFV
jgi:membrane-associated phospholipid phosphatase